MGEVLMCIICGKHSDPSETEPTAFWGRVGPFRRLDGRSVSFCPDCTMDIAWVMLKR